MSPLLSLFSSEPYGFADLLSYSHCVEDGVIGLKDGALMTAFYFGGPDLEAATHEELARLSTGVNRALTQLGDGWMLQVDAIRRPSVGYPRTGAFPDPTTRLIDEERRARYLGEGHHFDSVYALTLTYCPPMAAKTQRRLARWFITDTGPKREAQELQLEFFCKTVEELRASLAAWRIALGQMSSEELLTFLHHCITGLHQPVHLPALPVDLDSLLASQDFWTGYAPKIGQLHIRVIGLTGFPHQSFPQLFSFLNTLPIEYRWSQRFLFLDPATAHQQLTPVRRQWYDTRHSATGMLKESLNLGTQTFQNQDALAMAHDTDEAMNEVRSNLLRFGYYTAVIVLFHEDPEEVDHRAAEVLKEVRHRGFAARLEETNAVEAYLGSLPGHGYHNVRRLLLHTLNLADFLPLTRIWPGLKENPCPLYPKSSPVLLFATTSGATPFRLNLHVSDVGHVLIIGPIGAGKSTLVALMEAQFFRYPHAQVFAFENGYSSYVLTQACGGQYYDIGGDAGPTFCPLAQIDTEAERLWVQEWLEMLIALQGVQVTPEQSAALTHALLLLSTQPRRTLTDFVATVQDETIRSALHYYTLAGALGPMFDAEADSLTTGRFQVFELSRVIHLKQKVLLPILFYLFHRVEERLTGQPTFIVIEEAWMTALNSAFGSRVEEWLRTLRKKNAAVALLTQSVGDIGQSQWRDVLLEACPTKIFLPNAEAERPYVRSLYESMGLNAREIEILATAIPKQEYYYVSPHGRRLFTLGLGPAALSFLGVAGAEVRARVETLRAAHGERWPAEWLKSQGVTDAATQWLKLV